MKPQLHLHSAQLIQDLIKYKKNWIFVPLLCQEWCKKVVDYLMMIQTIQASPNLTNSNTMDTYLQEQAAIDDIYRIWMDIKASS